MVGRGWFVLALFVFLIVGVFFEQRFIDTTCVSMQIQVEELSSEIEKNDLEKSKEKCEDVKKFWQEKEVVLSLLVDFKDIEKIGSQLCLVSAHLENEDFQLAFVETKLLFHAIKVFYETVSFDFQNVI